MITVDETSKIFKTSFSDILIKAKVKKKKNSEKIVIKESYGHLVNKA